MTESMSIASAAGQVLVGGFEGTQLSDEVSDALQNGELGGVVLFRRNIESLEQVASLNERVSAAAGSLGGAASRPWICIDQEGGRVVRLHPALGATEIPPMRSVGQTGDHRLAAAVGEAIASEVAAVGFNVNFAPVLDVDTNPVNPIIGDRSFGADPGLVARMGGALMTGHFIAGVVPCGKHFPGHGDTDVDSHVGLPVLRHDRARLDAIELVPFRRLARSGLPMIMTAHILFPELDEDHPATLSPVVIERLLRKELRYEGLIVSDDLEMAAVADRYGVEDAVLRGIRAGIDIFLICKQVGLWKQAFRALVHEAENDSEFREQLFTAAQRVLDHKKEYLPAGAWTRRKGWRALIGSDEHRELMAGIE